ncbi:hypothetical protein [Paenibacillus hexagrammi]|uniref:Uncharacterized protein n=1 Tax=Paenibacillus hexagrammi TaxID=2908839 RepID=A0ABY3SJ83_9BACL|nr:hypothetical protein [Paenibacillus sp. YPD9-1]UJF34001.1 hypothetical protein L0M14_01815 [Paenibacillus sp. YPD9-1]
MKEEELIAKLKDSMTDTLKQFIEHKGTAPQFGHDRGKRGAKADGSASAGSDASNQSAATAQ